MLYLDYNYFNNTILSYASGITSLKKLYLRSNALNGSIHIQGKSKGVKIKFLSIFKVNASRLNVTLLVFLHTNE